MKKIRVKVLKIKNVFYAKLPDIIINNFNISNSDSIEITIHDNLKDEQVEIWDVHPEDINSISFFINEEVHTMNMYSRIYIPERYRFFLPRKEQEFILSTNVGNIKTHITSNGYFTKGLRQWFYANGPLMPKDEIVIKSIKEDVNQYEMIYKKRNDENNN